MSTTSSMSRKTKKAAAGFAPANSDFADRRLSYLAIPPCFRKQDTGIREQSNNYFFKLSPVPCALIPKKAGDGIWTRDPHLGKVTLYH